MLLLDDSPAIVQTAEEAIGEAGLHAVKCDNGAKLAKMARKLQPELILMAAYLDTADALEVCEQLGDDLELAGIPIVIMRSRDDPTAARFTRELGVVDQITKPFAPEALAAVIQHTLNKDRGGAAPRRKPSSTGATPQARLAAVIGALHREQLSDAQLAQRLVALAGQGDTRADWEALLGEGPGAALAGDLAMVPLAEVVQLLSLQRQSGLLRVRRDAAEVVLAFTQGKVRSVTGVRMPEELLLGNILVREEIVDRHQLNLVLQSRRESDFRLGSQLLGLEKVTRAALARALRLQSAELVYELLRWKGGSFTFERMAELPEAAVEFDFELGIDELLMEGYRRVDEWQVIEGAIPSFDAVVERRWGGGEERSPPGLTEEERDVFARVDDQRTVAEIIKIVGWGTFAVAQVLYRLVSARVVGLREP